MNFRNLKYSVFYIESRPFRIIILSFLTSLFEFYTTVYGNVFFYRGKERMKLTNPTFFLVVVVVFLLTQSMTRGIILVYHGFVVSFFKGPFNYRLLVGPNGLVSISRRRVRITRAWLSNIWTLRQYRES